MTISVGEPASDPVDADHRRCAAELGAGRGAQRNRESRENLVKVNLTFPTH